MMNKTANGQIELLDMLIKQVIMRIKEAEQETTQAYTQEDVLSKQGAKWELVRWKIRLERMRKKIKYTLSEQVKL